jgi:hypothetical protein
MKSHHNRSDKGSQSKARDTRKTPGKAAKLPPMPATKKGATTVKGTQRKVKGY